VKTAIVGFSAPKTWKPGAEFIKLWQGGTLYSHVYLRLYSTYTQNWLVYQASHGAVNCVHYDNFLQSNKIIAEFRRPVSDEALQATVRLAQIYLGRPYGYIGLLRLGARKILPKVVGDGTKSFHCSEFIATLFPDLANSVDVDFVEPVHLFNVLSAQ
jgi:hypothetical protein